jgi:hypothetical protein
MSRLKWTLVAIAVLGGGTASAQVQPVDPTRFTITTEAQGTLQARVAVRAPNINNPAQVVERVLSFDADGDSRIVADELPERMQDLIGRADENKDGYLTSDEIRRMVSTARSFPGNVTIGSHDGLTGVVNDLRLPQPRHDQALSIVKGYTVPRIVNNPNSVEMKDVHAKMRALLDDQEYESFAAAADRLRRVPNIVVRSGAVGLPPPPPPPPPSVR